MKKLHTLAAAAVIGAMSMSVQADNSWSAQYSMIELDTAFTEISVASIDFGYAYGVADNIDIEGYVGFGVGDDEVGTTTVELDLTYGLAAIYSMEVSDAVDLSAQLAFNAVDFGDFGDDSEVGFGVGAAYAMGSGALTLEYRTLIEDVTAISIGYSMDL